MTEKKYIEFDAVIEAFDDPAVERNYGDVDPDSVIRVIKAIPAADVLPRDEAIKIGAELAAMHGATPEHQQLEEAYLKGVEDGMKRRDVRPVVRGKWVNYGDEYRPDIKCCMCGQRKPILLGNFNFNFCPNCGADMRGNNG